VTPPPYTIRDEPLFGALQTIDLPDLIDQVEEAWYNQALIRVDDVMVRLAVVQGEFHWHTHDNQDEFFLVLDGKLRVEVEAAEPVELQPKQAFTVPAGMRHRSAAPVRSSVLIIERVGTLPAGD
jgi:mannose-6-phosphate isomerase-like protein (cupin superfamily)